MSIDDLRNQRINDTTDVFTRSNAALQRRMINFETGKSDLTYGHQQFLDMLLANTPETREFKCHIYAFTSKLGDTKSNTQLAFERARSVCRYLEQKDPKYTSRMMTYQIDGQSSPYKGAKDDNSGFWRAVEIHWNQDRPPEVLEDAKDPDKPSITNMKWSVCGCFSMMGSVGLGQYGLSFFRIRNDETKMMHIFVAPVLGVGISNWDAAKMLKFMKGLKEAGGAAATVAGALLDKVLANPSLLANPMGIFKSIASGVGQGLSGSDWTDFTEATVLVPIRASQLDGKTLANASVTGIVYQKQRIVIYGPVWYKDGEGKDMFGTKDIMWLDSSGWQAQMPALGAAATGGPLIMIR